MGVILAHRGAPPEAIQKRSEEWRPAAGGSQPLVSGGPGSRPPGTTTWLRGARCTDPEEMPEKEARPPAQNRHGGAPRGAPPSVEGGGPPRRVPGLPRTLAGRGCPLAPERLSALRPPLDRGGE